MMMAEKKTRLDVAVFERGLSDSRAKASALIMAGQVFVNGQKVLKSGQNVKEDDKIEVRGEKMPFVSRGGYKLDKAVKAFDLSLKDKICMDIPIACCKTVRQKCFRLTWDTVSLPGNFVPMNAL